MHGVSEHSKYQRIFSWWPITHIKKYQSINENHKLNISIHSTNISNTCLLNSFYVRVSTMTAYIDGGSQIKVHTNERTHGQKFISIQFVTTIIIIAHLAVTKAGRIVGMIGWNFRRLDKDDFLHVANILTNLLTLHCSRHKQHMVEMKLWNLIQNVKYTYCCIQRNFSDEIFTLKPNLIQNKLGISC